MYNVHSGVGGVSEQTERLVAELPPELKRLVDADSRTNKEVVEAALWREFGGERLGSLERRIEEKQDRINMIQREKNERERELEQEQEELEALRLKHEQLEKEETVGRKQKEELWAEAESAIQIERMGGLRVIVSPDSHVETWADRLEMPVDAFRAELKERTGETDG